MSAVAERVRVAAMIRDLEDRIRGYGDRALVAFSAAWTRRWCWCSPRARSGPTGSRR